MMIYWWGQTLEDERKMAKLGVGVGDEFPIEEKAPDSADSAGNQSDEACRRWREQRDAWHRHWREQDRHGRPTTWHHPSARRIAPALIAIGGIALLIAIISHFFYFILGAAVLAALFYLYRDHHGAMWEMHPRTPPEAH
jgi:hypothetical protein